MAWLTVEEFTDKHIAETATAVGYNSIEDALNAAISFIVRKLGEDVRDYVANAEGATLTETKYLDLRDAQDLLAFRRMLLDGGFASRVRDGGIQHSEKDLNDSAVNTYESFAKETESRRAALYREAMEILDPYLIGAEGAELPTTLNYLQTTTNWM